MIINNYMVKGRLKKLCIKRVPIRVKQIARKQLRAIAKNVYMIEANILLENI